MSHTPTVSVLMSCYNAEESVFQAARSILDQSFKNFEFVIVDDGSTDKTKDILREFSTTDDRIIIINNEKNIGLAASLNKGIKQCKGKYIARMDADDFSLSERFRKQVDYLEKHCDIDILGSSVLIRPQVNADANGETLMPTSHDEIISRVFKKTMVLHPTIMLRREIYDIALYDATLRWAEDADLWFRIYDQVRWANLAEPLLIYTVKPGLTKKVVNGNLDVIINNLRRRGKLLRYVPYLFRYVIEYNLRLFFGR